MLHILINGLITAGKGYNPTVTWNAIGGYYTAELKGNDPFLGAILSKTSSSIGSAAGASIQIPMNKFVNPISKKYEWFPTGVWTITKPAPKNNISAILGNVADSTGSELSNKWMENKSKNKE